MKIAGIIVAAGRSSRFEGANKLLTTTAGKPLIQHVIDAAAGARLDDLVVVVGPESADLMTDVVAGAGRTVINPNPADGLSSSIRCGLKAIDADCDGALILLADMPRVSSSLINQLCEAFEASNAKAIVFPQARDGRQGNPVLWPRALFPDLMALSGDNGGKAVLRSRPDLHAVIQTSDDAAFLDIDTRADLNRLKDKTP